MGLTPQNGDFFDEVSFCSGFAYEFVHLLKFMFILNHILDTKNKMLLTHGAPFPLTWLKLSILTQSS
ncbi:MAG: hypothetical protein CM15mP102_03910 [Flavobacteriales bacterium]|nr:MAG: hypothetical protein CM15mP102_03910 [Flavobacteriales bacterium]